MSNHRRRRIILDDVDESLDGALETGSESVSNSSGPPAKKRKKVVKTEEDAIPLPDPYPLPAHYGADVEVALKNGKLTKSTRVAFLEKVATSMLYHKRYPTAADYDCVGRAIIEKYPFMKSSVARSPAVSMLLK